MRFVFSPKELFASFVRFVFKPPKELFVFSSKELFVSFVRFVFKLLKELFVFSPVSKHSTRDVITLYRSLTLPSRNALISSTEAVLASPFPALPPSRPRDEELAKHELMTCSVPE